MCRRSIATRVPPLVFVPPTSASAQPMVHTQFRGDGRASPVAIVQAASGYFLTQLQLTSAMSQLDVHFSAEAKVSWLSSLASGNFASERPR